MNRRKQRQCGNKRRHRSRGGALLALAGSTKTFGDLSLVTYECPHCGGWHVGHPPKAEQGRLRFTRLLALIDAANGRGGDRRFTS